MLPTVITATVTTVVDRRARPGPEAAHDRGRDRAEEQGDHERPLRGAERHVVDPFDRREQRGPRLATAVDSTARNTSTATSTWGCPYPFVDT